ncbi:glycine--tRNA ligase subunit beta [Erythrobacter sp. THAF29]|uniref:glycine--tRNA ligase subunit beta n=1 Tax=Erythrobacter sp. THAF29 TaxID=2587851 RepID=UPI00126907DA|nr:glycine--tRNA ligase subunit beta [Erythrobacter sp. THAF29]QFT77851.1 Glycine--tRNA ligase beta subunit [Erythrobacter sp. THAF29]
MADFLLELRSEEIPARMQAGARTELEKLFRREMDEAGVAVGDLTVWSTPRRLALIAKGLPKETEAVRDEAKGPPVGAPDQAVDGFCRKNGVSREQLEVREVKGRETWFAIIEKPGQAVADLLANAITNIIRDFSWPKSMRWGEASLSSESLRWVRPLSGIVALLDGEVVPCVMDGLSSGRETMGHRFHSEGAITIEGADDYAEKLRAACVIVDHEERQNLIRERASAAAKAEGLNLVEDEGLVIENAGLTEWPVPLLGRFDEQFLDVPPEVIQLTARVNQKYFVCTDKQGNLANAFVCTANIEAVDPAVVVDGNRKVLAARLSDARFFWELDQKTPLAEHAKKLERITFHDKLGTVVDKVDRVAKLARWLAEEGIIKADPDLVEQAARLAKADLVTEMVGEFPELQGLMGGYYAEKEGLPQEVAHAIRDHYKPVGQGDEVPTAPVTVAVSLADKLDTLVSFFAIDEKPTGSKDPFALRRAALGVLQLIEENRLRLNLAYPLASQAGELLLKTEPSLAKTGLRHFADLVPDYGTEAAAKAMMALLKSREQADANEGYETGKRAVDAAIDLLDFFADRLKVQQREAGVRHDLIDAVFALGGEDDLVRLLARVKALQAFVETENGTNLLAGYKRAANILKKEDYDAEPEHTGEEDPLALAGDPEFDEVVAAIASEREKPHALSYTPEPAEKALMDALDEVEPKVSEAIEAEDFEAAMAALASLRQPIDAFFDEVTVNDEDPERREARLALLARFRDAVHRVADFSRIEG